MRDICVPNRTPIIPRFEIYMDGTDPDVNLYPNGSIFRDNDNYLQFFIKVNTNTSRVIQNATTDEVATYWVKIINDSGDPHDFYLYTDAFFVPTPEQSVSARIIDA